VQNTSLSSEAFRWTLGPTQSPDQCVPQGFFWQAVNCLERKAVHPVSRLRRYISAPLYAFMASRGTTLFYSFISFTLLLIKRNRHKTKFDWNKLHTHFCLGSRTSITDRLLEVGRSFGRQCDQLTTSKSSVVLSWYTNSAFHCVLIVQHSQY
jgi:hypothetical protein